MRKALLIIFPALVIAVCMWVFGCGPANETQSPEKADVASSASRGAGASQTPAGSGLSGTLSLSGAWAIYPLAVKWGEAFQAQNPQVKPDISAGGAGKGMADALSGAVDIGMVSREVDEQERAKGAVPIFIAKDAVFATVSTANPALKQIQERGISLATLADIFITGKVTTWKQAVGGPDQPIHVYVRSDACGAAGAWASTLGKYKQEHLKGTGVYGDPGLLEAVRKDPLAIGFNNLGFLFTEQTPAAGAAVAPIDANRNGKADPEELIDTRDKAQQEVASGRYPGARREYFVTKGKPTGLALEFINFALSDAGTKVLEATGGYVPLSAAERAEQLANVR